ncbi:MAG: methylated-DNA--[protein]-cysteine S-methyltransferase [Myxococcota bacterium]|nr:methylated-DNA--[protein]-cysteine S-methyltransferase [Myxococcota bacterium]
MGERFAVTELDAPVGRLRLVASERGLARLGLPRGGDHGFSGWIRRRLPDAEEVASLPVLERASRELDEYFSGRRMVFEVPLDLHGTPFQIQVWNALREIPFGQTRTYAEIGRAVGRPGAARAVGTANASNPIPLIVPCHRVIAAGGKLGGYAGGLAIKRRLLALEGEAARADLL